MLKKINEKSNRMRMTDLKQLKVIYKLIEKIELKK